jgi:hypothetical protein
MEYQLVIQVKGESLDDFDAIVELEDCLINAVGDSANVDGHDFGSGEVNIFIRTSDPLATFSLLKYEMVTKEILSESTIAYRELDEEEYTVINPEEFSGTFKVL